MIVGGFGDSEDEPQLEGGEIRILAVPARADLGGVFRYAVGQLVVTDRYLRFLGVRGTVASALLHGPAGGQVVQLAVPRKSIRVVTVIPEGGDARLLLDGVADIPPFLLDGPDASNVRALLAG